MKKAILFLIFLLPLSVLSQSLTNEVKSTIKETESTKSGNFQDVITSFYQVAFKSISENEKGLEFNSTIFSIMKTYDKDILKTRSRAGINFYRNFEVGGKVNLDSKYNIEGYGTSISYSIVNKRNREFVNLNGTYYHALINQFEDLVNQSIAHITPGLSAGLVGQQLVSLSNDLHNLSSAILSNDMASAATMPYYAVFIADLDALIALNGIVDVNGTKSVKGAKIVDAAGTITTAASAAAYIANERELYYSGLENKPLLTLSADGAFNTEGKFNRGDVEAVFLAGTSFGEWDARTKFSYADTLGSGLVRTDFNFKLGYNFKVLKRKDKSSFIEFKLYSEYSKILRNPLPDEDEDKILIDGDLRIRVTDDVWIPLTIKYDTKNSNFLGFLNVTYNFGDD